MGEKKGGVYSYRLSEGGIQQGTGPRLLPQYDAVFPIGEQVKRAFLAVYPECSARTRIYHNRIDCEKIRKMSGQPGGFTDDFDGIRLLTVGRLTPQKAYPVAIEAMRNS